MINGKRCEYKESLKNNLIYVVDAIPQGQMQTGLGLVRDLEDVFNNNGIGSYCIHERADSIEHLRVLLKVLVEEAEKGVFPILHIEAHGASSHGLEIGEDVMCWEELHDWSACLNLATRNNYGLVLSSCYGAEITDFVSISSPCPYRFTIGARGEVEAGLLRDQMPRFYEKLIMTRDLGEALNELDARFVKFFSSEFFIDRVVEFVKISTRGKAFHQLKEDMVGTILDGRSHNAVMRKMARKRVVGMIRNPKFLIDRYMPVFLHGENPVSYDDIKKLLLANGANVQ